jgi:hypothetical protein
MNLRTEIWGFTMEKNEFREAVPDRSSHFSKACDGGRCRFEHKNHAMHATAITPTPPIVIPAIAAIDIYVGRPLTHSF